MPFLRLILANWEDSVVNIKRSHWHRDLAGDVFGPNSGLMRVVNDMDEGINGRALFLRNVNRQVKSA